MGPGQIGGDVAGDARADQHAFGAMLFEMLTGERAWPGTSAIAVAVARLVEPPPDPRQRRPELSRSLADVVLRCLARDRDARFASDAELAAALAAADTRGGEGERAPAQRPPALPERERSVAVLRFRNLGPQEDGYLVDGLGEDLVDVLSTVRGLRVRGRGDEDGAARDVVETGRKLGVDVIVDGSVRRAGEMLRVSARLVGVADGFQLWSARFDRSIAQAFALNDEVAHAIARALSKPHVEASRPQPSDPIAIDLYFQAKHAVGRFFSGAGSEEGRVLFDQALARAPNDPTILAAYVHAQIGRNFFAPLEPSAAKALVRRAIVAGEGLPDPWVALGAYRLNHLDDAASAVRALQRAIALAPSSGDAHDLAGRVLLEAGEIEEAVLHLERALWLDPTQRWARIDLMRAAALQGRWGHVRELLEGDAGPEWVAHRSIHIARLGAWAGASEHLPAPTTSSGDLRIRAIGELFARARGEPPFDGDALEAIRREMGVLLARAAPIPRARRFFHQLSAEVAAAAGRPDGTLEFVEKAVENGLVDLAWMDRLSLLEPVRASPAFVIARAKVAARADAVVAAWRGPLESPASALASLA